MAIVSVTLPAESLKPQLLLMMLAFSVVVLLPLVVEMPVRMAFE